MAKTTSTKRTKKSLKHRIKTYNFFIVLAALLGMMAGVLMVKLFYNYNPTPGPNQPQTGDCRTIDDSKYCKDDYVGLSEADAIDKAKKDNRPYRVVQRDGEGLAVTDDYSEQRLNFTVEDGKVVKVEFF